MRDLDDLDNKQIEALWAIGRELKDIFDPLDSHIDEIAAIVGDSYSKKSIAEGLDTIDYFLTRLFNIKPHGHDIPPVR